MSCRCFTLDEKSNEVIDRAKICSEIEDTGQPYKIIEATMNNNRMILRIQKLSEKEPGEWGTSCDSPEELSAKRSETKYSDQQSSHIQMSLPTTQNPPTFSLSSSQNLPNTELKNVRSNEIIENPNIFLLKIRKRSETWDKKKENIDLEFRAPRPWPNPISKKPKIFENHFSDIKHSEIIEEKKESIPTKNKKNKTKKKKKGKKRTKKKK